ncbi:MAG TPA: hypothetical protein VNA20_11875 [Frankiaceae bacterium]|nr:hypothetical protein [Frankiaceae bacterium]
MRQIITTLALTGGMLVAGATSAHADHDYCAAAYVGIEDGRPLVNPYLCVPGAPAHSTHIPSSTCFYNVEPSTPDVSWCVWLQEPW